MGSNADPPDLLVEAYRRCLRNIQQQYRGAMSRQSSSRIRVQLHRVGLLPHRCFCCCHAAVLDRTAVLLSEQGGSGGPVDVQESLV